MRETMITASDMATAIEENPYQGPFDLIKKLEKFPEIINSVHDSLEPHLIATYLNETANRFHKFYAECHVLTDDTALSIARLGLVRGTKTILSNGMEILGISAPEKL